MKKNIFKQHLQKRQTQIGLWLGLANPYAAEVCAACGMDWLLIDGEHAPNDLRSILAQLQSVAESSVPVIVRPPMDETWFIKQLLDIGVQTLLVPMVNTAEQAGRVVAATRYPQEGIRGVGSALARAAEFGSNPHYLHNANSEMCVLVQAETREALGNLAEIANVRGVDGVFIGPADLAADMGYLGEPEHPEVQKAIEQAFRVILDAGKAPGILFTKPALAERYIELGAAFVAVGTDVTVLAAGVRSLAAHFNQFKTRSASNA